MPAPLLIVIESSGVHLAEQLPDSHFGLRRALEVANAFTDDIVAERKKSQIRVRVCRSFGDDFRPTQIKVETKDEFAYT